MVSPFPAQEDEMKHWDLHSVQAEPSRPEIISSGNDARVIVLKLPAGGRLQDHEVHERAWLTVIEGDVEVSSGAGQKVRARVGSLFEFDPSERHEVSAITDVRLLLLLSPWPGEGHPGTMTLEDKATVRERS